MLLKIWLVDSWLGLFERFFLFAALAFMSLVVFFDFFLREFLDSGLIWAKEVSAYLMIWVGLLGHTEFSALGGGDSANPPPAKSCSIHGNRGNPPCRRFRFFPHLDYLGLCKRNPGIWGYLSFPRNPSMESTNHHAYRAVYYRFAVSRSGLAGREWRRTAAGR